MSDRAGYPTPHPEVNAVVDELLAGVREVLGDQFVGLYLHGSLAHGGFGEDSDIDYCVVTSGELPEAMHADLAAMHARLVSRGLPLAEKLEGTYVSTQWLRRVDPANTPYLCYDHATGLYPTRENNVVLALYVLREWGVVVAGPHPRSFIAPVSPDDLREAVRGILRDWWAPMFDDHTRLRTLIYQRYAVISMCRMLYTLEHGMVVPKTVAARWAQETLDERWQPLIAWYVRGSSAAKPDKLDEVVAFVRETVTRSVGADNGRTSSRSGEARGTGERP
jgi:hypothetical protein